MLNNIGVVQRLLRDWPAAEESLGRAAAMFTELGDSLHQAQSLANLGDLYSARRQRDRAADYYAEAATLLAGGGDQERASQVWRALSLLRLRQGRWLAAMSAMARSLELRPSPSPFQRLFRWLLHLALGQLRGS
jgi:tetratricopeptide (TPR) repeat protein